MLSFYFILFSIVGMNMDYQPDHYLNMRENAAKIFFENYARTMKEIGKECEVTINYFNKNVYLLKTSQVGNSNIKFNFFAIEKHSQEEILLFISKGDEYFFYDDIVDPEGNCFTKKTENLINKIIVNNAISDKTLFELINLHINYRNLNGHSYKIILPISPDNEAKKMNFNIYKFETNSNNERFISFLLWNSLSGNIHRISLIKRGSIVNIETELYGRMGEIRITI